MGKHKKEKKHKEKKSKRKHKKKHYSSDSSSSTEDEWIEKGSDKVKEAEEQKPATTERDEWMNLTSLAGLYSHKDQRKKDKEEKKEEKEASKYNPQTSGRELNPYWRDGGDGLPSAIKASKFMKPADDSYNYSKSSYKSRSSNWRKRSPNRERSPSPKITERPTSSKSTEIIYESEEVYSSSKSEEKPKISKDNSEDYLTDKEMNEIGAKIVKAEILGNLERVADLKAKLEKARLVRDTQPRPIEQEEEVLLTHTNAKGFSKPINEPSGDDLNSKRKKQTINTHDLGKRQKYYPDDGKHSLQNMFENEKFGNSYKQEEEFMKAASKLSKSDDLDDMFMDNIRVKDSDEKLNRRDRDRAIQEQQRISDSLNKCQHCIQSSSMLKHLMVTLGETVFLSLPQYEPITDGHCLLLPIRHVPCSTQLDENEWAEILQFRKSLTNMFKSENKTVVFYETAVNINSYPHMVIHCVPMPDKEGDMAPIYFKKGIDDCEMEWSTNKKLINMAGKDVRRTVPKGLPYFWVSFGLKEGFAHVIEEQRYFPKYFAEEIIGGILDLHHSKWRRSRAQNFEAQKLRVVDFSKNWNKFDCTVKQ